MKLNILNIAYHRNGIGGAPFSVVLFHDEETRKVALLFDQEAHCAVLDVAKLAEGDIAFGSNSWRGDQYEPLLRAETKTRLGTETTPLDIEAILASRSQIAIIWNIEDVKSIRPDLNEDQCWEVLESAKSNHDANDGISWITFEIIAQMLFGDAPETNETEEA
jgi:hypothetical protein